MEKINKKGHFLQFFLQMLLFTVGLINFSVTKITKQIFVTPHS